MHKQCDKLAALAMLVWFLEARVLDLQQEVDTNRARIHQQSSTITTAVKLMEQVCFCQYMWGEGLVKSLFLLPSNSEGEDRDKQLSGSRGRVTGMWRHGLGPLPFQLFMLRSTTPTIISHSTTLPIPRDNLMTIFDLHNDPQSRRWGTSYVRRWGTCSSSLTSNAPRSTGWGTSPGHGMLSVYPLTYNKLYWQTIYSS